MYLIFCLLFSYLLSLAQKPQFAVASYQKAAAEAIYKLIARGTAFEGKQEI